MRQAHPFDHDGPLFRLTHLQERIWLREMREPEGAVHNAPVVVLVRGELDEARLRFALATLVERNEALRAAFVQCDGVLWQFARADARAILDVTDLSPLRPAQRRQQLYASIRAESARPFDLTRGPLLRLALLRLGKRECVLVMTVHHIVSDGWSQGVLLGELAAVYLEAEVPAKEKARFFDYADAQRVALDAGRHEKSRRYWRRYIEDIHCVALPWDHVPASSQASVGNKRFFTIGADCGLRIRQLSAAAGVSPFAVFLALLGMLIERRVPDAGNWCLPVSVGYRTHERWFDVIGCFVEHVLVRPLADPRTPFAQYVRDVAAVWQQAFDHRDYPLDCLRMDAAHVGDALAPSIVFVYQNAAGMPSLPGIEMTPLALPDAPAKFDLTVMLAEEPDTFALSFEYDATRYEQATIADLGAQFLLLCERMLEDTARPVEAVMRGMPPPTVPSFVVGEQHAWPRASFAALFDAVATRHADSEALRMAEGSIRFRALRERVEDVALRLRMCNGTALRIGVHLDRSPELVVAMLATLTEGHCYVPLSPSYPDARLAALVRDSAPALVLTDARGVRRLRALSPGCETWDVADGPRGAYGPSSRRGEHAPGAPAYLVYTSGSMGQSKGVYGLADSLLNRLHWQWRTLPFAQGDRALLRSPPMFVDSIVETLAPVLGGICAVIATDEEVRDPLCLWPLLARERVTHLTVVPSYLESLLAARGCVAHVALKSIHCSGEALSRALARDVAAALPGVALINIYGSTEVTADVTWHRVDDGEPAIGRPIANTAIAIVDAHGNVLPRGAQGEIAVSGAPVSGGYRQAPALTAERFVPAPNGGRLFLTGDCGRIDASGRCEYLGRLDLQVKVRGMRTNVLEIEQALCACPGGREVIVMPDQGGRNRLVAYYLAAGEMSREALAAYANSVLPAHAVPNRWVPVRAIPRTDSGKVCRAFDVLEGQRALVADAEVREERLLSALERQVLAVWTEVLGQDMVGPDDHFEQVGGHSLLAIRLVETLNRHLGTSLRLTDFFAGPTVRQVAARLAADLARHPRDNSANGGEPSNAALVPDLAARYAPFPLLPLQQAYRLGRDANDRAAMSTICAFSMDYDALSLPDFAHALNRMIRRHDMLRAVLVVGDEDAQRILAEVPDYVIEQWDLSGQADDVRADELERLRESFARLCVEPGDWPSFRVGAARLDVSRYRLFFAFDMTFIDLFSARLLMRELESIYRRDESLFEPIGISFRDYVIAVRAAERSHEFERARAYWLTRADHLAKPPQLPVARRFAHDGARYRFRRRGWRLASAQWQALRARAQLRRVSPTSVLLSAYAATIGAWSGEDAFSLVVTTFNRLPLHPDVDKLVGDFTSTLIFGAQRVAGETALETCARVQAQLRDDLDHRAFGGVELLRELTRRNAGERIVLPVVFTSALGLVHAGSRATSLLAGRLVDSVTQTSHVWLDNQVEEADDGSLTVSWDAIDALFPPGLVDAMFERYRRTLIALASSDDPWTCALDSAGGANDRRLDDVPRTAPPVTLPAQVLQVARSVPDNVAVIAGERTLTYAAFVERAQRAAGALAALGVLPGTRVGLLLEKGWEAPVAMLAVALLGAAYVPIDPGWPDERRGTVAAISRLALVVTQRHLVMLAPAGCPSFVLDDAGLARAQPLIACAAQPDDVAYLMFTSGTTGTPKGVVIEHRAAANTIDAVNDLLRLTHVDRVLCVSSLCFDLSVYDIWGPLRRGAACVMMPSADGERPWHWPAFVEAHRVTIWNSVPALMELLLDASTGRAAALSSLRATLLSGDWIPLSMPERVRRLAPGTEVISLGGATEASIWSIHFPIGAIDPDWISIPYGRPLPNQVVYVLDSSMRPSPIWATGEIYIGGAGLAREYWAAPDRTAAQFVVHPDTGQRLYRTGDLGCCMPDGDIRILGRRDGQVKLNGLRVELGEIESVLEAHPLVKHALVRVEPSRRLSAHIVPTTPHAEDIADLHRKLSSHADAYLPSYMVPATIDVVASLPLGTNGKVDRSALVAAAPPRHNRGASSDVTVEPVVAELWQLMLSVEQPRKQDNFFASGGDSLIAMRFVAKLNAIFGLDLTARGIYDHPTLERLAEHVEACRHANLDLVEAMPLASADESAARFAPFPLTDIQRSYHVGRRDDMTLGAVAAQSYIEIDYVGLDLARFEQAVNRLIERHGMLRAVFPIDGGQRVLERVRHYEIAVEDIGGEPTPRQRARLDAKRARLARAAYDPAQWPLFSIEATRFGDGVVRMHISLDIIIADAWSTNVIARDLLALYHGVGASLPALRFAFRDYVEYMAVFHRTARYRRMRESWQARLDTLAPPPALPVRRASAGTSGATFTRYAQTLDEARWTRLKERSLACGATPSAMLLTVFSRVLLLASKTSSFVLNVTHFNRPPIHADINDIVGDFASTFLLEYRHREDEPLDRAIGALCRQILSDLDQSQYSGVRVLQDLSQRRGRVALAPVVFTSALVLPVNSGAALSADDLRGEVVYALTQTPQVWLDHQVYQEQGRLLLAWDVRDDVFDAELVRSLFDLYVAALERLVDDADAWHALRLDVAPAHLARCRARLEQLATDPGFTCEREDEAHVAAAVATLAAHPEVESVRAIRIDPAGSHEIRVTLREEAPRLWGRGIVQAGAAAPLPLERLELKRAWMIGEATATRGLPLPEPSDVQRAAHIARRSHRRFWGARLEPKALARLFEIAGTPRRPGKGGRPPVAADVLAWIASLGALRVDSMPLPKFAYPSAGSCYGVRAYLHVPPANAGTQLPAGSYELDPVARCLTRCTDAGPIWTSHADGPCVLLAADLARSASLYGEQAQAFAELEAGAMGEVLESAARELGFGMRARPLAGCGAAEGGLPIVAFALDADTSASTWHDTQPVVRARIHGRDGDGVRITTWLGGVCVADDIVAGHDAFARAARQVLVELSIDPSPDTPSSAIDARLALGAFAQRLMSAAPAHDIGLCILGYAPPGLPCDEPAAARCFLVGGPLDARQGSLAQGNIRAERALARTLLREYAQAALAHAEARVFIDGAGADTPSEEDRDHACAQAAEDAPVDLIDAAVRDIWQDVLRVPRISGHANFFRLGGTSIDALAILRRLHDRYFIELRLQDILAEPTVDAMARCLRNDTRWSATIHEVHALLAASSGATARSSAIG